MTTTVFEIETDGESGGICDCCGNTTRRVWGYANHNDATFAAYFVTWTIERPEDFARVDLIIGRWGDGASPSDRSHVQLTYSILHDGTFRVDDADHGFSSLAASSLTRAEVISTPVAETCFDLIDAIWLNDLRIAELSSDAYPTISSGLKK